MSPRFLLVMVLWAAPYAARAQHVFINEFHYNNSGSDTEEGIEIAGPAGTTLSEYDLVLYNGTANTGGLRVRYGSHRLSGIIPAQIAGAGCVWFPIQGIQNGNPDGMVLYHWPTATIVQKISYGGSFTADDGVAAGVLLPNLPVAENDSTMAGHSLQLTGSGGTLTDFTWGGPRTASRGSLNAGQSFTATPVRSAALAVLPGLLTEGESATLQLTLIPAPAAPVTFTLAAMDAGTVAVPALITVGTGGTATVAVTVLTDDIADGFFETIVRAIPADNSYPASAAGLQIIDADRPYSNTPGSFRLMSHNVNFGVGAPGTTEFAAVLETVERLSPDVMVMQEVAGTNVFADWLELAARAGFPVDEAHVAMSGDAFAGQPYVRGDLSGSADQSVVTVSRWPIRQRIQIGRGIAGRSEITRYPLLTVIDVPWLPDVADPVVVNVHLKAGGTDADNFRRALELWRVREALLDAGFDGTTRNIIVAGDFNDSDWQPQPTSYQTNSPAVTMPGSGQFADASTLPLSFVGGSDLTSPGFTLPYDRFPRSGLAAAGFSGLPLQQADGSDEATFSSPAFSSSKLDYFFLSQPITARGGARGEIYNSRRERQHDGLPKRKSLPDPMLSTRASDHFAIFADIPLLTLPVLSVTFSADRVNEGDAGLTATVTLTPAPVAPTVVALDSWRDPRLTVPASVILGPGTASLTIAVTVPHWPGIEPHRTVVLTATADGCSQGDGSVMVRNLEASGALVITQYHEPPAGNSPRAVELMNLSGRTIDFAASRLELRRYSNGGSDGLTDGSASGGMFPAGAVIVMGDETTGDYMVASGLLPAPAVPFASQPDGTVSLNTAGHAAFVLDQLVFTGDDALEILLDGTRSDVFGEIGHDPGNAWTGPGAETTADVALTLRATLMTGSSGWREPGYRFTASSGTGLAGFGVAPVVADPYLAWAAAAGLTELAAAPAGDPDHDGAVNLLEYGMMTSPADGRSRPVLTPVAAGFRRTLRTSDATLIFSVEATSGSLSAWQTATGLENDESTHAESVVRVFAPVPSGAGRTAWRQRVSRR